MEWLSLGQQIIANIAAPLISSVIKPAYDMLRPLWEDHSQTSEVVTGMYVTVSEAMGDPEKRENLDVERMHAYAEMTRSLIPFAFAEYLFYLTKVASVLSLASIFYYWYWRGKRSKSPDL